MWKTHLLMKFLRNRSVFWSLLLTLGLVASACGNNGVELTDDGQPDASEDSEDSEDSADIETVADTVVEPPIAGSDFIDAATITDPIADELVFSCNGLVASAADLDQAFDSTEAPTQALGYAYGPEAVEGSVSEYGTWARLETGWLIDREPLVSDPTAYRVAAPDGFSFACSFRRAGFFSLHPIAWQVADVSSVAIEACVDPESVVVDRRLVDGRDVVTLFGPYQDDTVEDCAVDGSVTMPLEGADQVLSGLTYPLRPPSPKNFELLGFGSGVATVDVVPVESRSCSVSGGQYGVAVEWPTQPAGLSVTVLADDVAVYTESPPRFEQSSSVYHALIERPTPGASSEIYELSQTYTNGLAPTDRSQAYQIRISGTGVDAVLVDCGTAAPSNFGSTEVAETGIVTSDLAAAGELFDQTAIGPYAYMTVSPICDDCAAATFQLHLAPGGPAGHRFSPSSATQTGGEAPGVLNPFGIHEVLDQAVVDGHDVTYEIDAKAGAIRKYTINGIGAEVLCIEVDTAPPSLREGRVCNPEWDLLT